MRTIICILSIVGVSSSAPRIPEGAISAPHRTVIAASEVIDGKGLILGDVRIEIEGPKIVAISPKIEGPAHYDLRGLTVLPGWIDAHVHITWIFGKDGKNAGTEGTTPEDAYLAASNAWVTFMAGFTTVQSVGSPNDIPLRDAIGKGSNSAPANPDRKRAAGRARRGDRYARRNTCFCEIAKRSGRRPDQNLRVEVDPPGRRNDSFAGAIERGL